MKVSALKENPDNPRKIDPIKLEKLINSIHEFPAMMELQFTTPYSKCGTVCL